MQRDRFKDIRRHLSAEAYRQQTGGALTSVVPTQPGPAAPAAQPVVVGYDGSASALPVLRWARDEARRRGAALTVVRAWQWDEELGDPGLVLSHAQLVDLAYSTLPDDVRSAPDVNVIVQGQAAGQAIVDAARSAGIVVVGRRRLGTMQRVWLGSVSSYVIEHVHCPVVVVPEIAAPADLTPAAATATSVAR